MNGTEKDGSTHVAHPTDVSARGMQISEGKHRHDILLEVLNDSGCYYPFVIMRSPQAVKHHNLHVAVVDEISSEAEVNAVRTIAQRGMGMVRSATPFV